MKPLRLVNLNFKNSLSLKLQWTVALAMTTILLICTNCLKGPDMSILQSKPLYKINLNAFGVVYYIEVNGVTIFSEFNPQGQITTSLPVNHWMRSGENTIGLIAYPDEKTEPFNPHSYIKIAMAVHEHSEPDDGYTVATLHFFGRRDENQSHTGQSSPSGNYESSRGFEQDASGNVKVFDVTASPRDAYPGAILFERKINIPSSLPLWAFFSSDDIPDYNAIEDDAEYEKAYEPLFIEYEKIQNALAKRDVESILPMFEERNKETDMAFYREPGTTAAGMRESLQSTVNDPDLELLGLSIDNVGPLVEGNKKIVSLRSDGLDPAIILNFVKAKKGMGSKRYPMYFRLQDGQWILTR